MSRVIPILRKPDTTEAHSFLPGLGYAKGMLGRRTKPVRAIVVHTTGVGVLARYEREKAKRGWLTPMDAGEFIYTNVMPHSGHYLVDQLGRCVQHVPEDHIAQHVGSRWFESYRLMRPAKWWRDRWPTMVSPRELGGGMLWDTSTPWNWNDDSANENSIGIEVIPNINGKTPWTQATWDKLAALVLDIAHRNNVPLARDTIISHSDAHPRMRQSGGRPWDPSPEQWSFEKFCSEAGI